MAISYGQFTGWVSVSYVVKSEPSCTSHKPRASYQRWLVRGDLVHGNCPHATTQSYAGQGRRAGGGGGGVTLLIVVNNTNDVFPTEHYRNTMNCTVHKELH